MEGAIIEQKKKKAKNWLNYGLIIGYLGQLNTEPIKIIDEKSKNIFKRKLKRYEKEWARKIKW